MLDKLRLMWSQADPGLRFFPGWRTLALIIGCWVLMVAVPSQRAVRSGLCLPLYVHDVDAQGDVAYVMAGGYAYLERLRAASDLFHMRRIDEIYLLDERQSSGYDFVQQRSQSKVEQATKYLGMLGVPREHIHRVPERANAWMGSLSEAQMFAAHRPASISRVVVVTSAPHTRRSRLCFRRSLPAALGIQVYSASLPSQSTEVYLPLWHEYFKLLVYYICA